MPSINSNDEDANDIVLIDKMKPIIVRCEVCDVASESAGANRKEMKDLNSLGCANEVPRDGVKRYICSSKEFAEALTSKTRMWSKKHYRYERIMLHDPADSQLLQVS